MGDYENVFVEFYFVRRACRIECLWWGRSTYFSDVKVVKAEKKNEEPRYKVWLSNGFELKFYKDGGWQKVDGNLQVLPSALQIDILPGNLLTYVATQYPTAEIVEAARYDWGYEVELNTAPLVELEFDNNGNVMQIDRDWPGYLSEGSRFSIRLLV